MYSHYKGTRMILTFFVMVLMCFVVRIDGKDLNILMMKKMSLAPPFFGAARYYALEKNISVTFYLADTSKELRVAVEKAQLGGKFKFRGSVVTVNMDNADCRGMGCHKRELRRTKTMELTGQSISGFVIDPYWIPDLNPGLYNLTDWIEQDLPLCWDDILVYARTLAKCNGSYVAVPLDSNVLLLYYRIDRLQRLKAHVPRTWDDYLNIAEAESEMDLNGDLLPDYGSCISHFDDTIAARVFMSFVYPMIQTKGTPQGGFFQYGEDDMSLTPMVNNEAFEKALGDWKEEGRYNNDADGDITLEVSRKLYLQGKCALTVDYPNLLLELYSCENYARDLTGFTLSPGSKVVLSRKTNMLKSCKGSPKLCPFTELPFDRPPPDERIPPPFDKDHEEAFDAHVNYAPLLAGGWSGAVNAKSSHDAKFLAYSFFSHISSPEFSNEMVTKGSLNPFRVSQFSMSNVRFLMESGMPRQVAMKYLGLLRSIYTHPNLALGFHIVNGSLIEDTIMNLANLRGRVDEEELEHTQTVIGNLTDSMCLADKIEYLSFLGNVIRISEEHDLFPPSSFFDYGDDDDDSLLALYIALPVGLVVFLTLATIGGLLYWRRRRVKIYSAVERTNDASVPLRPFDWKIDPSQLKLRQKLVTTTFGDIFRGFYQGEEVQVMQIKADLITESVRRQIASEMPLLCDLSHCNVLQIKGGCLEPPEMFVVAESTTQSLYEAIHQENLPPRIVHSLVCDIARGMDYLHSCAPPILHTKLSSVNLLLDKKFNVKIVNFGNYMYFGASGARHRNVLWTAPEVLNGDSPTEKSDVYSFGIVLWELLSCKDPYEGVNIQHVAISVQDGLRPFIPTQWKKKVVDLIEDCWSSDPDSRPTFKAIRSRLADIRPGWMKPTFTSRLASEFGQPRVNPSKMYSGSEFSGFSSTDFEIAEKLNGDVTILYTNIFGYTTLWRSAPTDMEQAILIHNELMRNLFVLWNGIIVKTENDCFTVVFSDSLNALKCALAAQQDLMDLPWPKGILEQETAVEHRDGSGNLMFRGLRVRMGIHSGELNEKNSSGIINVTTKIGALAEGGEILASKRTIKKIRSFDKSLEDIEILDVRRQKGGNKVFSVFSPRFRYRFMESIDSARLYPVSKTPSSLSSASIMDSLLHPIPSSSSGSITRSAHWNNEIETVVGGSGITVSNKPPIGSDPSSLNINLYGIDEDIEHGEIDQQTLTLTAKQMIEDFGSYTENWFIPFEQLKLKKKIGEGSFGEVYKAQWRGTTVAVKRFFKQQKNDHIMLELRKESTIMRDLRHPNILLFLGSCIKPPNLCIVTQYMKNGCVGKYLRNRSNAMPWSLRLSMVKQVSLALAYLHTFSPPIIHRDLSSYNLLVDDDLTVKVADFGLCRIKASNAVMMTKCGTAAWAAPEVLEGLPYSEAADVYSYAIVLWEFLTRKKPHKGLPTTAVVHSTISGFRPTLPESAPSSYVLLIRDCWKAVASARPTFEQVSDRLDAIAAEAERDVWII